MDAVWIYGCTLYLAVGWILSILSFPMGRHVSSWDRIWACFHAPFIALLWIFLIDYILKQIKEQED